MSSVPMQVQVFKGASENSAMREKSLNVVDVPSAMKINSAGVDVKLGKERAQSAETLVSEANATCTGSSDADEGSTAHQLTDEIVAERLDTAIRYIDECRSEVRRACLEVIDEFFDAQMLLAKGRRSRIETELLPQLRATRAMQENTTSTLQKVFLAMKDYKQ